VIGFRDGDTVVGRFDDGPPVWARAVYADAHGDALVWVDRAGRRIVGTLSDFASVHHDDPMRHDVT
jgi:hypothetical protein